MTYAKLTRDNLAKKKKKKIHCKSEMENGGLRSTKKVYYAASVCI